MGRSRTLYDVCVAMASHFASRNNDLGGWWALGVICRTHDAADVRINLWPEVAVTDDLTSRFHAHLVRHLKVRNLDGTRVSEAGIVVEFSDHQSSDQSYAYSVEAWLRDDHGYRWSHRVDGRCRPHDPARELRSLRAEVDNHLP